ncbi:MAG: hypothetical protein ACTSSQ_05395 [Alphaproteobacteria bacterium]
MPDYRAILRRSIDSLPENNPAMRQAVYDRARAALARQLTAVEPPLSADDLEAQHQRLEDAIAEIEVAVERGEDPELAGIDWDTIDNEFSQFESAANEPPPAYQHSADMRNEPRGAQFAPDPSMDFDTSIDPSARVRKAKASRAPFFIFMILLLLVMGGAGAVAYTQWDRVQSVAQSLLASALPAKDDPEGAMSAPPKPFAETEADSGAMVAADAGTDTEADGSKNTDRLIDNGIGLSVSAGQDGITVSAIPTQPLGVPASSGGSNLVGQRAIFYEQGADGASGAVQEGAIGWTQITQPDGAPAIQAKIDVPDKGLAVTVTVSRNLDNALPASHLIEISFDSGSSISAAEIDRIPALVVKPNEQARGQPLTGAAVPVTETLFCIALSSDKEQESQNLSLMRDGAWFDMPILFKDGTRALITFEKGIPGDQVFETVLASWLP